MTRARDRILCVFLAAFAAMLCISCDIDGRRQQYAPIGDDAEGLRAAFNAAAGKIRIVVLVSPT